MCNNIESKPSSLSLKISLHGKNAHSQRLPSHFPPLSFPNISAHPFGTCQINQSQSSPCPSTCPPQSPTLPNHLLALPTSAEGLQDAPTSGNWVGPCVLAQLSLTVGFGKCKQDALGSVPVGILPTPCLSVCLWWCVGVCMGVDVCVGVYWCEWGFMGVYGCGYGCLYGMIGAKRMCVWYDWGKAYSTCTRTTAITGNTLNTIKHPTTSPPKPTPPHHSPPYLECCCLQCTAIGKRQRPWCIGASLLEGLQVLSALFLRHATREKVDAWYSRWYAAEHGAHSVVCNHSWRGWLSIEAWGDVPCVLPYYPWWGWVAVYFPPPALVYTYNTLARDTNTS